MRTSFIKPAKALAQLAAVMLTLGFNAGVNAACVIIGDHSEFGLGDVVSIVDNQSTAPGSGTVVGIRSDGTYDVIPEESPSSGGGVLSSSTVAVNCDNGTDAIEILEPLSDTWINSTQAAAVEIAGTCSGAGAITFGSSDAAAIIPSGVCGSDGAGRFRVLSDLTGVSDQSDLTITATLNSASDQHTLRGIDFTPPSLSANSSASLLEGNLISDVEIKSIFNVVASDMQDAAVSADTVEVDVDGQTLPFVVNAASYLVSFSVTDAAGNSSGLTGRVLTGTPASITITSPDPSTAIGGPGAASVRFEGDCSNVGAPISLSMPGATFQSGITCQANNRWVANSSNLSGVLSGARFLAAVLEPGLAEDFETYLIDNDPAQINPGSPQSILPGTDYSLAMAQTGASAIEQPSGDLISASELSITNDQGGFPITDTQVGQSFTIFYNFTDDLGNISAQKTRLVTVVSPTDYVLVNLTPQDGLQGTSTRAFFDWRVDQGSNQDVIVDAAVFELRLTRTELSSPSDCESLDPDDLETDQLFTYGGDRTYYESSLFELLHGHRYFWCTRLASSDSGASSEWTFSTFVTRSAEISSVQLESTPDTSDSNPGGAPLFQVIATTSETGPSEVILFKETLSGDLVELDREFLNAERQAHFLVSVADALSEEVVSLKARVRRETGVLGPLSTSFRYYYDPSASLTSPEIAAVDADQFKGAIRWPVVDGDDGRFTYRVYRRVGDERCLADPSDCYNRVTPFTFVGEVDDRGDGVVEFQDPQFPASPPAQGVSYFAVTFDPLTFQTSLRSNSVSFDDNENVRLGVDPATGDSSFYRVELREREGFRIRVYLEEKLPLLLGEMDNSPDIIADVQQYVSETGSCDRSRNDDEESVVQSFDLLNRITDTSQNLTRAIPLLTLQGDPDRQYCVTVCLTDPTARVSEFEGSGGEGLCLITEISPKLSSDFSGIESLSARPDGVSLKATWKPDPVRGLVDADFINYIVTYTDQFDRFGNPDFSSESPSLSISDIETTSAVITNLESNKKYCVLVESVNELRDVRGSEQVMCEVTTNIYPVISKVRWTPLPSRPGTFELCSTVRQAIPQVDEFTPIQIAQAGPTSVELSGLQIGASLTGMSAVSSLAQKLVQGSTYAAVSVTDGSVFDSCITVDLASEVGVDELNHMSYSIQYTNNYGLSGSSAGEARPYEGVARVSGTFAATSLCSLSKDSSSPSLYLILSFLILGLLVVSRGSKYIN